MRGVYRPSLRTRSSRKIEINRTFERAEQAGLKLAIKGRLIALLLVGFYLVVTRGPERAVDIIAALLMLAALGIAHFVIIGSNWDRPWIKYAFVSIDLLILSAAIAVVAPEPRIPLPQIFMFRFDVFLYYFMILGVSAFSFSPGLVLWVGVLGASGWLTAFAWVRSGMEGPLEWGDAVATGSRERYLEVILSPDFVASGSRVQEALIFLVVAVLLAVVMHRARQTVRRQLEAERDRATLSRIFGRFVPEAVANALISQQGALDPVERSGTVLFIDIVEFTSLMESRGPRLTVNVLNDYFDAATEIIGRNHGVVTQFIGDGILAVFNVPIENEAHAECAYNAAKEILAKVRDSRFSGENVAVRIGLNTGPLIAGVVGGGGRQSYTVYGDTVNLASRLEVLNKQYGTSLLVSESTAALLPAAELERIGEVEIRGLSAPVGVHTLARS